jgi:hypothetical protein
VAALFGVEMRELELIILPINVKASTVIVFSNS